MSLFFRDSPLEHAQSTASPQKRGDLKPAQAGVDLQAAVAPPQGRADTMDSLARVLERAVLYHRKTPAIRDAVAALDYGELIERARRLAGALKAKGIAPGERVAILARNSFRYIEVALACAEAGVILVPLNIRLASAEIDRILERVEARLLFQALPYPAAGLETVGWDDTDGLGAPCPYEMLLASAAPLETATPGALDDVAQIFFTSGTTGEPKGVCLTGRNLLMSSLDSIIALNLQREDVWFHSAPMFHLVDAFAIWAITLIGARHVTAHFEPASFAETVELERITQASLPPTLLDMIAKHPNTPRHDVSSLRRISYGGSPMPRAVYDRTKAALRCDLVQTYGITEAAGMVCQQLPGDVDPDRPGRENSVGQPVLNVALRVVDDEGRPQPAGVVGELAVSGPHVMAGYWRDPEATAAAVRDGWYHTGDLGVYDEDGHFTIVGRKKDMIISGGENVYPAEVENALLLHPQVAEAAVFGVPSARWGEEVRAVVLPVEGASGLDGAVLIEHCRGLIAGYKTPKAISLAAEPLPKSGPGKIAKALVRAAYLEKAPA
jgi:acyl-CoA synthetase (AMP-forming)/AMP-acid ligase II